ncbi:MAG: dihydroorotate dehydrogenase electron transfer subunit [Lachnospiraceae bacterium]|nr:dihydroorotate dehydrogenase electron transfer subunit [Lachnospiraceae bacterium]
MTKTIGNVISQLQIATNIYSMTIETDIAMSAKPGQFVSMYCHDETKILPRPISICQIDSKAMTIRVVYRIAGKGTEEFATYRDGDKIELMGPLGNGFPIDEIDPLSKVVLMGGGIGIPPMVGCAEALRERGITTSAVMGYRDKETFLQDEFRKVCDLYVATEDGSVGIKGNVIELLNRTEIPCNVIFACGPTPMLSAIKSFAVARGITCYVSMEERMACGIGACLGCVCKTKEVDEHSQVKNKRVCKDGPVFLAGEIDL